MGNSAETPSSKIDLETLAAAVANKLHSEPKRKVSPIIAVVNSPFIVTVLGGIILWALSAVWQDMQADASAKRQQLENLFSERKELLVTFADTIPRTLMIARDLKKREVWIAANRPKSDQLYRDGRNFTETQNLYEESIRELTLSKSPAALTAQIQALFDSERAISLAVEFSDQFETLVKLQGADANPQIRSLINRLNENYTALVAQMTEELRNVRGPAN